MTRADPIPRDRENDYSEEQAGRRRDFLAQKTEARLDTVARYATEPAQTRGNVENFIGTAQVPLGVAGPLRIEG
ncbi:MAG: hypothetical protein PVJ33_13850, partial [Lysobacterales bacterium]